MTKARIFSDDWPAINAIEGWLEKPSGAVIDMLLSAQKDLAVPSSGIMEIGVWKGRSAAVIARHLHPKEDMLLADVWLRPEEITAGLKTVLGDQLTEMNISLFHGGSQQLVHRLPSEKAFRFIHIDGEHTASALRADLSLAHRCLDRSGLIMLDDIFHPMYPQLTQELFAFLAQEGRDLACALLAFNKVALCRTKTLSQYSDWLFDSANQAMAERGVPITLCRTTDSIEWPGFSMVHDIGIARRGHDDMPSELRR